MYRTEITHFFNDGHFGNPARIFPPSKKGCKKYSLTVTNGLAGTAGFPQECTAQGSFAKD
jgi:hypothetical protein